MSFGRSFGSALGRAAAGLGRLLLGGGADSEPRSASAARAALAAHAGRSVSGTYANAAGSRPYLLYVASGAALHRAGPPLLVMLHGCKQTPADFAAGTRMNEHAEAAGWLVLYPGQRSDANRSGCWNWFQPGDQHRGQGEPSLIAGLTRETMVRYGVDRTRVCVAGLSAGGTMAATMASAYRDLYAACGVHSGLPHGAAHNLVSALHAMRRGARAPAVGPPRDAPGGAVPTIVFHGDRDRTVHPRNGERVIAQATAQLAGHPTAQPVAAESAGRAPAGRRATRTIYRGTDGRTVGEHWLVHGTGHAWSGGSTAGSYADPLGPDASREMLRFFAEHPRRATASR